jgi:hypothetical protein
MKSIITAGLFFVACGPDGYTTQGIPVYIDGGASISINELSAAIDIAEDEITTAHPSTRIEFANMYHTDYLQINVKRKPFECGSIKLAAGCYTPGMISIVGPGKHNCIGNTPIAHEFMHVYKMDMDNGDSSHNDRDAFMGPNVDFRDASMEGRALTRIIAERCQ